MAIGERIKEIRLKKGYTLEKLAEKIGVTKSTFFKYENGSVAVSPEKIIKLSQILNCSPMYLMGLENKGGLISVREEKEEYDLTPSELAEFEKLKNMQTSLFLFNDKQLSADAMEKFEQALLEAFIDTIKQRKDKS